MLGLLKNKKEGQMAIFYFAQRSRRLRYYGDVIHSLSLENGSDLHVNERQKIRHYRARSTEE